MNCDKEFYLTLSKSKAKWWLIITLFSLTTIGLTLVGCCKETENSDSDEYYVKYELVHTGRIISVTVNTENNEDLVFTSSFDNSTTWETIIGPVNKGFNASMDVRREYDGIMHASIYVTKNGSPFAMKKTDESNELRDNLQISYTIDY